MQGFVGVDMTIEGKGGHSSLPPQDGSQVGYCPQAPCCCAPHVLPCSGSCCQQTPLTAANVPN